MKKFLAIMAVALALVLMGCSDGEPDDNNNADVIGTQTKKASPPLKISPRSLA